MDTLQVALLIYFVVGLVAIPILYRLFGGGEAQSDNREVRSEVKDVDRERLGETVDLGHSDQVNPRTSEGGRCGAGFTQKL